MPAAPLRYINASSIRFTLPEGAAHLRAELEDELCVLEVKIRRAFPFSATDRHLSIQDGAGKEIGIVADPSELDPRSKELVDRELDRRYFTPKITAIDTLKLEGGMWTFEVQTQRGRAAFYVRNWRDSAHEIAAGRIQVNSVDGQRFEIADYEALDARSKSLMDQLF